MSSPRTAEFLVETGLLAPTGSALILLPGAHGTGVGLASVIIYVGVGFVLGSLFSLSKALDYVWDDKNMERIASSDAEKGSIDIED